MIIKNSNLRRAVVSNRYKILIIIISIILALCLIQVLNSFSKQELNQVKEETKTTKNTYTPEETIISGGKVKENQQQRNTQIIDEFMKYCNEKKIQEAYNLLTNECKENIFLSSMENFEQNYINKIFTKKRIYRTQSWINKIGYTYKITIQEDILATGNVTEKAIEDYYTIVKVGEEYKLNISGYIGKDEIKKEKESNNIKVAVTNKDIYKEYEVYHFSIENKTDKTILLDSKEKTDTTYLKSANDRKYSSYLHEIEESRLQIKPGQNKTFSIKFNKIYSNSIGMSYVVFEDIILDKQTYDATTNKQEYTQRIKLQVEL